MRLAVLARGGLWAGVLGMLVLAAFGALGASDEGAGVKIVSPPEKAVLLTCKIDVICSAEGSGPLQVDGEPRAWDTYQSPVRVARLWLDPGLHELRIGGRRAEFVVGLNEAEHDGPREWPLYRVHKIDPGADGCAKCHPTTKASDGRVSVGEFNSFETCMECHKSVEFEAIHSHILEPLKECQLCHGIHGAPERKLLKAPAKKLCEECHDPDH